ncbi:MAG: TIR domain-containing protein [Deltaproteobacteria bacterium]|nr:TIR domain-containing protein [Deltaproteobacteria bacterium]
MYDLFITHAWRYHEDWTKICDMLNAVPGLAWRNFSLPWHDPAMDPNSEIGGKFIRDSLETQIIPAHGVIVLAGVYRVKSARRWLDLEVEMARTHNKPIIGMPPIGEALVSDEVKALCDATVGWDAAALIAALDEIRGRKESGVR